MKTVLILRHAKSDWGNTGQADFDRPLAKRGLEDAPRMGEVLALFKCVPDNILSSPAKRARQTAELVAKACNYHQAIQWEDSFYGGSSLDLIKPLQNLSDSIERVLLIGHNPVLEEFVTILGASAFSARGNEEDEGWTIKLPTAGLVCLSFDIRSWDDLEPGLGVLQWFVIPKLVRAIQKKSEEK
jgi:phosphohistidine phosphatase